MLCASVSGQSQHDGLQVTTPDYKLEDKYMGFCSVCWPVSVKPVENLFLASSTISGPLLGTRNWRREFFHSTFQKCLYVHFVFDRLMKSVKSSGYFGGQAKTPTVIHPDLYKHRFSEAMNRYFLPVPD